MNKLKEIKVYIFGLPLFQIVIIINIKTKEPYRLHLQCKCQFKTTVW